MIDKVCAEAGIPVFELNTAFASAIKSGQFPYRDDIHPNAIGQKLIADSIMQMLE